MKDLYNRFKKIDWGRGNGSIIVGLTIVLLGLAFMIMVMEYNNMYTVNAIAQTRADAIADAAASYSVSYDYTFNQREAYEQAVLMTAYNNSEKKPITASLEIIPDRRGKNTKLEVAVTATGRFYTPSRSGRTTFQMTRVSAVEVVNTTGEQFIIVG
jgi:Flp pilus assembly protein TadG